MQRHVRKRLVVLLVALLLIGGLPAVAGAQETGGPDAGGDSPAGSAVRIDPGETYDGSLDVTAGSVVIAGTVDGDVSAAAGSVIVTESGRVTGSLDAAAGSVLIEGRVDGDVSVGAAALELGENSRVGGTLEAGAADVRVHGTVDGDTTLSADTLVVGSTATLGGSLTYAAENVSLADEASVSGTVTRQESVQVSGPDVFGSGGGPSVPEIPGWVGSVYFGLADLLLGAVLLIAAPTVSRRLVETGTDRPLRSAGVGLLSVVGVPILLVVLLLTVVGIPLSIAGLVAFGVLLWIASVYGAIILGAGALSLADYENRWAALLVGVAVASVAGALPIPVVGGLVQFAILLVGLGAFALVVYDYRGGGDEPTATDTATATAAESG